MLNMVFKEGRERFASGSQMSQGPGRRSARAVQEEMLGSGERNINLVALEQGWGRGLV